MIGQTVSHYRILEKLGQGGMGIVYLAEDILLGRRVAIKTLTPAQGSANQHFRTRFLREARAASKLSHPHIATIYDYGETTDGQPYLVMELVQGKTLSDLLREESLRIPRTIEIVREVAEALSEAHHHGLVHRDIKPSNIAINERGNVKVLDFGLAKEVVTVASASDPSLLANTQTREGIIVGTPMYFSPEQALGLEVDARSDLFSLGSVLYECVTGRPAFPGTSDIEICAKVIRDEPPPPSKINPKVPGELDRVTLKALAKNSDLRYQSAEELAHEIDVISKSIAASAGPGKNRILKRYQTFSRLFSFRAARAAIVPLTLMTLLILVVMYFFSLRHQSPQGAERMNFIRIAMSGNVKEAAISPDGKYVGAIIEEFGKQSLWLKQSETPNELNILKPSDGQYKGVSFSPDGNYVYYLLEEGDTATLYRLGVLGGTPEKLASHVDTPVTFSAGGDRLAFVRQDSTDKSTSLVIAKADGSQQVNLLTMRSPQALNLNGFYSSGPAWSPDGSVIAVPAYNITEGSNMDVLAVAVKDGSFKTINKQHWLLIEKLIWRSDGTGLVMNAIDRRPSPLQLWRLSYHTGEASRLTNDPNSYVNLSTTRDFTSILVTKLERLSSTWIVDVKNRSTPTSISTTKDIAGTGIAWTPDNHLIYSASDSASQNLWIMRPDGTDSQQLTFGERKDLEPVVSPDGRYLVFVSYTNEQPHLWKIDRTNSKLTQLTWGAYEDLPRFSADGKSLIYHSIDDDKYNLRKIPVEGGESVVLTSQTSTQPDISPNGKLIACFSRAKPENSPWAITLLSTAGGPIIKTLSIPASVNPEWPGIRWTVDGSALIYVATSGGVSNLWLRPVNGGPTRQLTQFTDGQIFAFDRSITSGLIVCVRGTLKRELLVLKPQH